MKLVLEEGNGNFVRKNIRDHAGQASLYFRWSPQVFFLRCFRKDQEGKWVYKPVRL